MGFYFVMNFVEEILIAENLKEISA